MLHVALVREKSLPGRRNAPPPKLKCQISLFKKSWGVKSRPISRVILRKQAYTFIPKRAYPVVDGPFGRVLRQPSAYELRAASERERAARAGRGTRDTAHSGNGPPPPSENGPVFFIRPRGGACSKRKACRRAGNRNQPSTLNYSACNFKYESVFNIHGDNLLGIGQAMQTTTSFYQLFLLSKTRQ